MEATTVITILISLLGITLVFYVRQCFRTKNALKDTLRKAFRQGYHHERRVFLKAVVDAVHNEYTEDNWYTSCYWLVEEILISDKKFGSYLFSNDFNGECIKRGLADAVDEAMRQKGLNKGV